MSLPMILLTIFALGILLIDLMLPEDWKWANAMMAFVGGRHDVHGLGMGRGAHLHWPGTDGDLDLRAGRFSAARPAIQRGLAEVLVAGGVLVRNFRLRIVAALWADRKHESGDHPAAPGAANGGVRRSS